MLHLLADGRDVAGRQHQLPDQTISLTDTKGKAIVDKKGEPVLVPASVWLDIDIILNLPKLRVPFVSDLNDTVRDKLVQVDNIRVGRNHILFTRGCSSLTIEA